jgi:glutamyl-tRNA synthetase
MSPEVRDVHVRFAPSQTGRLHPGNARTALVNALFARRHGGCFTLRIDDTDPTREEAGAVDAIRRDLAWLGIPPDDEVRQSGRAARYAEAARGLMEAGAAYGAEGAVRLRLAGGIERWDDGVHGAMAVDLAHQRDPVLLRADGRATYTLASVVDDLDMAVSHVIRGDDHLTNTGVHRRLCRGLGGEPPVFAHLPLVVDTAGTPLSKRDAALTLESLRRAGVEPEPLAAYLAGLGTGRTVAPGADPAAHLDLAGFSTAPPTFDPAELVRAQERWLATLDVEAVDARRRARGQEPVDGGLWEAVRGNLTGRGEAPWAGLATLAALDDWRAIAAGEITPAIDDADRDFLAAAADALDDEVDGEAWLAGLSEATGRRGKRLRLPIRRALSGRSDGPPLGDLLALTGRVRARRRLRGERT